MYSKFNSIILEQAKDDIRGVVYENKENLNNIVKGVARSFVAVGNNEFIIETLNKGGLNKVDESRNKLKIIEEYKNIFLLSVGSLLDEYALYFYVNDQLPLGKNLNTDMTNGFLNTGTGIYSEKDIKDKIWYKKTLSSKAPLLVFRTEDNPNYIYFSKRITVQDANSRYFKKELGICVFAIDCTQLLNDVRSYSITNEVQLAVLDSENNVICKSTDMLQDRFIINTIQEFSVGLDIINEFETDKYLVNSAKTDSGITFVSFVSTDSIYLKTREISSVVLMAILVTILFAFLVLYIISYCLTKPIEKLSGYMRKIDYDNLKISIVEPTGKDEVCELYKTFNSLLDNLYVSKMKENEQNERARKMEIKVLQTQINPHFLYNVLDSISWIAMLNGQEKISEMAELLAQIFAYSIKDGKMMAKLSEEIGCVEKYVMLQRNRYNESINLFVEVSSNCMDFSVPKCILQPLVENSIIHGLVDKEDGINIKISAKKHDGYIEIFVEDDGSGCEPEILYNILEGKDGRKNNHHLGIKNVNLRLKQLYENDSGLSYTRNDYGGVTARILIQEKKIKHLL